MSKDLEFLRRWERWRRRGLILYLIESLLGSAIVVGLLVFCVRNLVDNGVTVSAWHGFIKTDYAIIAGALFGSVTTLLARFCSNEARYERLMQVRRKA